MNLLKWKKYQIFLITSGVWLFSNTVTCVPILKVGSEYKQQLKDEKHYPNGSVIGKYAYVDHEGNPVEVKYYADDSSYGLELKSIKFMKNSVDAPALQTDKTDSMKNTIEPVKLASNLFAINYHVIGKENNTPYDDLDKELSKLKTNKGDKANTDYEIFYQKELRPPKKCNKDKFKVYFDKEKRQVRNLNEKHRACGSNLL